MSPGGGIGIHTWLRAMALLSMRVQVPPWAHKQGRIAQRPERFVYTEDVLGSNPGAPTEFF